MQLGNRLFKGAIPTIDHVASAEAWGARGMGRFHLSSSFPRALSAYFITLIFITPTFFGACPVKIALWLVWVINPHLNISFCVKISLLKPLSSPVYTRANHERFRPGFVLPFTHKTWIRNQNFPVSSWIRKLLNPELQVETLYLDTYESETLCSVNALRIQISRMWWIREPLL